MSTYRDCDIKITSAVRWKLGCIVRALNHIDNDNDLNVPSSVDAFADKLLAEWITEHHPELNEIWLERESATAKAAARLAQKYETPKPIHQATA